MKSFLEFKQQITEEVKLDESKEHIEQHLADRDINSSVEGKTVKVHSSDIASAKKHMKMMGYKDHKVVGGLNEEIEPEELDEISDELKNRYATKAAITNFGKKAIMRKKQQSYDKSGSLTKMLTKRPDFTQKEKDKMARTHKRLTDIMGEEVEDLDEGKNGLWANIHAKRKRIEAGSGERMRKPGSKGAPSDEDLKNASEETVVESKHYDQGSFAALKGKPYSENPHPKGSKEHLDWSKGHNATRAMKEETLDELSKATLGSYVKKASEQGKKAAVSKNQSDRGATDSLSSGNDRLHDLHIGNIAYQSKLEKKRTAGISKAVDKLTKEEAEQIDELSKDTLTSYGHKAFKQGNDLHYDLAHSRGDKATDAERQALRDKISKRNKGIIKANAKIKKEETNMISYSEFMAKLEESSASERAAEILAAKRAERLDKYDFSKEKHKPVSAVKQVKGRSYGADQPDNEDDEDEKKKSSEPEVKRGRGRPAGSKSGARV